MRNIQLDDYYDNDSFLELVEEYSDLSDRELKHKIAEDVYGYIYEAHGKASDMLINLSEARTRINAMQYIINNRENDNA
jgi:hypothetical protein